MAFLIFRRSFVTVYTVRTFFAEGKVLVDLDGWTEAELEKTIHEASRIEGAGSRIAFLSGFFLGLRYRESTLIGDDNTAEVFVINLSEVDCFTFIDYIEAMRLSDSYERFLENLRGVRYRNSTVDYVNRKHFFTDWADYEPVFVDDFTTQIGGGRDKNAIKMLNLKEDGMLYLPGIRPYHRSVNYIPSENIDDSVLQALKTGDYAGIYSSRQGLDVSHVGIIIRDEDSIVLRHASSNRRYRKVIDQDLKEYISEKPGLIILRPRD
jgi:hypothetical protein